MYIVASIIVIIMIITSLIIAKGETRRILSVILLVFSIGCFVYGVSQFSQALDKSKSPLYDGESRDSYSQNADEQIVNSFVYMGSSIIIFITSLVGLAKSKNVIQQFTVNQNYVPNYSRTNMNSKNNSNQSITQLEKLTDLKNSGILTEEEYNQKVELINNNNQQGYFDFCVKCGSMRRDRESFCHNCGNSLKI